MEHLVLMICMNVVSSFQRLICTPLCCWDTNFFPPFCSFNKVQRRADWKLIDKAVEKQLFGLKLADDCLIS